MKKAFVILIVALFSTSKVLPQKASGHTYCKPVNVSYRFSFDKPSHLNAGRQTIDYRKKTMQVKAGDKMTITMVRNGGFAAVLK